jgi:hypothetical protein
MPIARRDDLRLHYELTPAGAREAGTPVLLVMGLGVSATGWWPTVPILAESRPVIAFDNRGVGRSDRVPDPYSTPEMADDAIAVLDGAGFERARVYGISLGGHDRPGDRPAPPRPRGRARAGSDGGGRARRDIARRDDARLLPPSRRDAGLRGGVGVGPLQLRLHDAPASTRSASPTTSSSASGTRSSPSPTALN